MIEHCWRTRELALHSTFIGKHLDFNQKWQWHFSLMLEVCGLPFWALQIDFCNSITSRGDRRVAPVMECLSLSLITSATPRRACLLQHRQAIFAFVVFHIRPAAHQWRAWFEGTWVLQAEPYATQDATLWETVPSKSKAVPSPGRKHSLPYSDGSPSGPWQVPKALKEAPPSPAASPMQTSELSSSTPRCCNFPDRFSACCLTCFLDCHSACVAPNLLLHWLCHNWVESRFQELFLIHITWQSYSASTIWLCVAKFITKDDKKDVFIATAS